MDIAKLLHGHPWADTIQYFDCIDSTNTYLQKLAVSGAPEGTVILADSQSAGKGRRGRSFHSPAGSGIYMSVLLRPNCKPEQLMHLTCAVAVEACRAIEAVVGVTPQIKWVNDLLWQGKKLAGILTAVSAQPDTGLVKWAVIGIGINCSHCDFPPDVAAIATTLEDVCQKPIHRAALTAELIRRLEILSRTLIPEQRAYMEEYRKNCVVIGKDVRLIRGEECQNARVVDITDDGALLALLPDGTKQTVNSGEVSLRGAENYV